MKNIKVWATAVLMLGTLWISQQAQAHRGGTHIKYSTTYSTWDRSFTRTYSYRETDVRCGGWNTCYSGWSSYDRVYVQETIIEEGRWNGYRRVTVYRTETYRDPYAYYYVRGNTVVYREYCHPHVYIRTPLITEVALGIIDNKKDLDATAAQLMVTGAIAIDIGVFVAKIGAISDDKDMRNVGLVLAGVGLLSMSSASEAQAEAMRKSQLAQEITNQEASKDNGNLRN